MESWNCCKGGWWVWVWVGGVGVVVEGVGGGVGGGVGRVISATSP